MAMTIIAYYVGEIEDAQTKVCLYESALGTHSYDAGIAEQCPLTIEVSDGR
jgi:hypothetical protein